MKIIAIARDITLLALVLSIPGCITAETIDHAEGCVYTNENGEEVVAVKPKPALYILLPLTVPTDCVTFPFQLLIGYLEIKGAMPFVPPMRDSM